MSKKKLIKKIKKLSIDDGKLKFNGQPFRTSGGVSPFEHFTFIKQLSHGANGVTYIVQHKHLLSEQLVKLYFVDDEQSKEKAISESQKNSALNMADSTARVYDLGVLSNPTKVVYSVMELVDDAKTFREYLEIRNNCLKVMGNIQKESLLQRGSLLGEIFQESIIVACYFLRCVAYLIKNNIRHGDLNPGNILICNSIMERVINNGNNIQFRIDEDCAIPSYSNKPDTKINVGMIDGHDLSVKLIDLGASCVKPSSPEKTNQRDTWFIYDTVNKLLLPFFEALGYENGLLTFANFKIIGKYQVKKIEYFLPISKVSYTSKSNTKFSVNCGKIQFRNSMQKKKYYKQLLMNREIFENGQVIPLQMQNDRLSKDFMFERKRFFNAQIPFQMISAELLKIVALVNILFGIFYNGGSLEQDDDMNKEIQSIIEAGTLSDDYTVSDRNIVFSSLFDYRFYEAANILLRKNLEGKLWSNNLLFNYDDMNRKILKKLKKDNTTQ